MASPTRLLSLLALTLASPAFGQINQERARDAGRCTANPLNPHWINVDANENRVAEGVVTKSIAAYSDWPLHHESHDWDLYVRVDNAYKGLVSTANEPGILAVEWEMNNYPVEFRPIVGDRIWVMGRWIWDCGHQPYMTEIHPPVATAVIREEPAVFPGDSAPSLTRKAYVYIHGRGGYHNAPAAVRDYEFDIHLPTRPSSAAVLRAEVIAVPFGDVRPILTMLPAQNKVRVRYPLLAVNDPSPDRQFGAVILAGWSEPVLSRAYRSLQITLREVKINEGHTGFLDEGGNWHLWVQAGPRWLEVLRATKGPGVRDPNSANGDVDDGSTVPVRGMASLIVPESGSLPVTLRSTGWESDRMDNHFGIGHPNPADLNAIDENDRIGVLDVSFSKAQNFGIGNQDVASKKNPDPGADADTNRDFNLRFRIDEGTHFPVGTPLKPTVAGQQCPSVNDPFLATTTDDQGRVVPFPSFEPLSGDSRVTIELEVEPYRVQERDQAGNIVERLVPQKLLVQLPGQSNRVRLESGTGARRCRFYFPQLSFGKESAAEVLFEFQLEGRPYSGFGPPRAEDAYGKLAEWSSYGMKIKVREEYYLRKHKGR